MAGRDREGIPETACREGGADRPAQGSSMPFAYEVQVHLACLLSQTRKVLSDLCPTCFSSHVFPNEHIAVRNFQITLTPSV